VASSYFDFSLPEPMGVVGILAPEEPALLGLITHLAPVVVSGNAAVVILAERRPLAGLEFAEILATSDLPAGVVHFLSGRKDELAPHLARHMDVNAIAEAGAEPAVALEVQRDAAVNVKRVHSHRFADYTAPAAQGLDLIGEFVEIKTTWHPVGW
jgi:acyl-CoA reductase-like NAD-dependent aldehyde dehydrogenase